MFDTLSSVALTAGAALVVAFLSHALAETARGRLTAAAALTPLVQPGSGVRRDWPRRSRAPRGSGIGRGGRRARRGPYRTLRLPSRGPRGDAVDLIAGAGGGPRHPRPRRHLCRALRAREASGALRSNRGLGRHRRWGRCAPGRGADRAFRLARPPACAPVEHRRLRRPCRRDRAWRPLGAGSAPGLCRTADERPDDDGAVADHSSLPRALPPLHPPRHLRAAGENRSP